MKLAAAELHMPCSLRAFGLKHGVPEILKFSGGPGGVMFLSRWSRGAIENGHRNSGITRKRMLIFHIVMLVDQRVMAYNQQTWMNTESSEYLYGNLKYIKIY